MLRIGQIRESSAKSSINLMYSRGFVLMVLFTASLFGVGDFVPKVFYELNHAVAEKDKGRIIRLIDFIESNRSSDDKILFGGGIGPFDADSLLVKVLGVVESEYLMTPIDFANGDSAYSIQISNWMLVDPSDEASIVPLLRHADVVARWFGVSKLSKMSKATEAVIGELYKIAETDPFFVISRDPPDSSTADISGLPGNFFSAPIREAAVNSLVKLRNEEVRLNSDTLVEDGILWLGKLFLSEKTDEEGLFNAVSKLAGYHPAIRELQAAAKTWKGFNPDGDYKGDVEIQKYMTSLKGYVGGQRLLFSEKINPVDKVGGAVSSAQNGLSSSPSVSSQTSEQSLSGAIAEVNSVSWWAIGGGFVFVLSAGVWLLRFTRKGR